MEQRIFTLSEAVSMLPQLEEHFEDIKKERAIIHLGREDIKKASKKADLGGGSLYGPRYIHALEQISRHLEEIHQSGVLVKDLEAGLCDFPYLMDGRVVYLCWKLGESEITWWHETDAGFAGRQPLNQDCE